jgi:regulator of sigma E protease
MTTRNNHLIARKLRGNLRRGRVMLFSVGVPIALTFSLAAAAGSVWKALLVLIGFGSVIFFHELGHFLAAKSFGVRCDVFAVGIGPRLCGWRKGAGFSFGDVEIGPAKADASTSGEIGSDMAEKPVLGETDYRLAWLPFGGYVRMLGQDDMDPAKVSEDPASFGKKPVWQRMIIISAGVTMNIIFAIVVFAIVFRMGLMVQPAIIGGVAYDSPAQKAGLHVGDEIISINHHRPRGFLEFPDLQMAAALGGRRNVIELQYHPNGSKAVRNVSLKAVVPPGGGLLSIGVSSAPSLNIPRMSKSNFQRLLKSNPKLAAMRPGCRIISCDGVAVHGWGQLYDLIQASNGHLMRFTLRSRKGVIYHATDRATLDTRSWVTSIPPVLGMYPRIVLEAVEPGSAGAKAGLKAGDVIVRVGALTNPDISSFRKSIEENAGQKIAVEVLRGDRHLTLNCTPESQSGKGFLGVAMGLNFASPVVGSVTHAMAALGVRPGATISAIGPVGVPPAKLQAVKNWYDLFEAAKKFDGRKVRIVFAGKFSPVTVNLHGSLMTFLRQYHYRIGLALLPALRLQKSHSVYGAVAMGLNHTWNWILRTYSTLRGLGSGTVPAHELHGVVGIVPILYESESMGNTMLLYFLGSISVNLAVINFLPLPVLDGGLFVMLLIEKIRGRPLSVKVQTAIQLVGITLIAGIFLYVTIFNDLPSFFGH